MFRRTAELALCLAVAGCGLVVPPRAGPHGLTSYDGELRRLSGLGQFDDALALAEEEGDAAGDDLLAALNLAIVEHYAGRYEESNRHLEAADVEIEERFTKSVSRAAVSLLTSDRALAWLPSPSERLMIHVYGALNYLALGETDEAAVEARRLAFRLDELVDESSTGAGGLAPETRQLYRSLRYFTGALFGQAGERNDAEVAYRLAGIGAETDAEGASAEGASAGTSAVVIVVESGFVAHRVERSAHLLVGVDELDDLRYGAEERRLRFARCFSQRRLDRAMNSWGAADDDWCDGVRYASGGTKRDEKDDDVAYLLRIAWPTMYRPLSAAPLDPVRAFSGGSRARVLTASRHATALQPASDPAAASDTSTAARPAATGAELGESVGTGAPLPSADLSGAVISDFNRDAPGILAKSVLRAAVKYAVVQAIEDGVAKEDETLGDVAAVVANAVAALTERADTRSWALLPAQLQLVRLELPPGTHEIRVEASGSGSRTLDLGTVHLRAGEVAVLAARVWP